jgi:peptide/nickel transport system substrate-binding protein
MADAEFWFVGAYHELAEGTPIADIRVREALSLAINRQEIIDTMSNGLGTLPAFPRLSWEDPDMASMTPETLAKWKDWFANAYRYDQTEAKRLIEEAGYGNGFTFEISYAPDIDVPFIGDLIEACAGYWEQVGASATILALDSATFKPMRNTKNSTKLVGNMAVDGALFPNDTTVPYLNRWTTKLGSMNLFVGNPEKEAAFDKLYLTALSEVDSAKRADLIDQILGMIAPTWTGFSVMHSPRLCAFGPRVDGYFPAGSRSLADHYADWKYTGVEPQW